MLRRAFTVLWTCACLASGEGCLLLAEPPAGLSGEQVPVGQDPCELLLACCDALDGEVESYMLEYCYDMTTGSTTCPTTLCDMADGYDLCMPYACAAGCPRDAC